MKPELDMKRIQKYLCLEVELHQRSKLAIWCEDQPSRWEVEEALLSKVRSRLEMEK